MRLTNPGFENCWLSEFKFISKPVLYLQSYNFPKTPYHFLKSSDLLLKPILNFKGTLFHLNQHPEALYIYLPPAEMHYLFVKMEKIQNTLLYYWPINYLDRSVKNCLRKKTLLYDSILQNDKRKFTLKMTFKSHLQKIFLSNFVWEREILTLRERIKTLFTMEQDTSVCQNSGFSYLQWGLVAAL